MVEITQPKGFVPRSKGCDLPAQYAQKAENLNVFSGRFEAWRAPELVVQFPYPVCRAHVSECCWDGSNSLGDRYVTTRLTPKTYLSRPSQRPLVTDSLCDTAWSFLGYPQPDPVSINVDSGISVVGGPDLQSRTYVVTYGTECEEGPPSCPTDAVKVDKRSRVELLLPSPPEIEWGVTHINVYRSQSLWDTEQGFVEFNDSAINTGFTSVATQQEYFLVARLPIGQASFLDDVEDQTLGDALDQTANFPPPEGSTVVGESDRNSLIVYEGSCLYLSERNRHHAFPVKYRHSFPGKILHAAICGSQIFVLTTRGGYLVNDDVDCQQSPSRPVLDIKDLPIADRCSDVVVLRDGVLYSSQEGLVSLKVSGSWQLASRLAFEKDDWRTLGPIRSLAKGRDHLILSTDQEEYFWALSFDENGYLPADLTTLSFTVDHWIEDEDGSLYFLSDGSVYQFDAGVQHMRLDWVQAEQRYANRASISAIGVDYVKKNSAETNCITLYRDGKLSVQKQLRKSARVRGSATQCSQIGVSGREPMCSLTYAQGLNNLRGDRS